MSPRLAAADRLVITAARRIEQAAQYGLDATAAVRGYEQARTAQAAARRQEAAR